ncbi:MAG: helix-turn-helix transcriptional regulator [Gemmatimonadota bacterium]|nr:MAG: helix-turn-helix transcriptional regulator [Gemmatimonadota bacterium]
MGTIRIPKWWLVTGQDEAEAVEVLFRYILTNLPMTHAELAEEIGVAQSTVTRWARGDTHPSFDDMARAVRAASNRVEQVRNTMTHTMHLLIAIDSGLGEVAQGHRGARRTTRKEVRRILKKAGFKGTWDDSRKS